MSTPVTILIIVSSGGAVIALGYFAARQLIKAFGDEDPIKPIEGRPLIDLCDCEAGSGRRGRYYHAINCRYRRYLEQEC